ncbi:glycosyl transferase [filamentous cyanobacterium CCP5]|nr:glycosyl transferase [filamentous cyanobacterium CCP5]
MDFTVVIPTYNGAERLPAVLEHLRKQVVSPNLSWEILIVDNNSQDNTRQVITTYQADPLFPVEIRYSFEPQQGAAYARLRAVHEAKGEWIGFLDDDNWPEPNWLTVASQFRYQSPRLGAFSGKIVLATDAILPLNFSRIAGFLAIRDHGNIPWPFVPECLQLPPAASLFVRKQAWIDNVPAMPILGGRRRNFFVQGDDYEPLIYLYKAGWEIWYAPELQTAHQLPAHRFERAYLIRIAHACGLATCQLRLLMDDSHQIPKTVVRTILGGLKRTLLFLLIHRHRAYQDVVLRAELAFHWGSTLSPWICWQLRRS